MNRTITKAVVLAIIALGVCGAAYSDVVQKKVSKVIKFTGTIIDNVSLKEHGDSLALYLPRLKKEDVYNNVKSGYSLAFTDGKVYPLAFETVSCLWNDIRSPRGGSTLHSLKISGNARKLGGDTLKIIDFVEVK